MADHCAGTIPQRPRGRTGARVSAPGLGGHLGDFDAVGQAIRLVHQAVGAGVTCFDNELDKSTRKYDVDDYDHGHRAACLPRWHFSYHLQGGPSGAQPPS